MALTETSAASASNDDGLETSTGTIDRTSAVFTAEYTAQTVRWAYFRAPAIDIGQRDKIISASIDLFCSFTGTMDATIFGYAGDDAPQLTGTTSEISNFARTTASVEWDEEQSVTVVYTSPDISSVIREIINRSGWASGNDIGIILRINSTHDTRNRAYDLGPGTTPPEINIVHRSRVAQ